MASPRAEETEIRLGKPGRVDRKPTDEDRFRANLVYTSKLCPALDAGDTQRAVSAAYQILKFLPRDGQIWDFLLEALRKGDAPRSIQLEAARQAVSVLPRHPEAHRTRARIALESNDPMLIAQLVPPYLESCGATLSREVAQRLEDDILWAKQQLLRQRQQDALRAERAAKKAAPKAPRVKRAAATKGEAPPEEVRPSRSLKVPVDGPAGSAASLVLSPLDALVQRLRGREQDGPGALDLVLQAADARATEAFDRLLSLETLRGVDHLPHQSETVLRTLKRFQGRVLLADEVGLGKTIEACLVLAEYLARDLVQRALILCPPALVGQWRSELAEKFSIEARTSLDPELSRDPEAFFAGEGVVVVSIATARMERYRKTVLSQRFDLVVVDEAHHLKNRTTRAYTLVDALRSRFLLLLTATPVETNLSELYNLVTLLRPGTLGTESEFRKRYHDKRDPMKPRDAAGLRELLRDVMIRNTRAQSGVSLPPRTARTLVVEPSEQEKAMYGALAALARAAAGQRPALFRLLLEQGGSSPYAVAKTAASAEAPVAELTAAMREVARLAGQVRVWSKAERLLEHLPGGKVLVFTRFLATHAALSHELERKGVRYVPFTGSMSGAQRTAAVEAFANDADVLLCSEVGGEGQNLQFCHRIVNFDLPWNPMQIEQRIGRVHRIGQTEPVEILNLCTGGTAEEHILEILDQRINLFELVVGEMDLLLGELEDERAFDDRVFDIYATAGSADEVATGFDALGEALQQARARMAAVKDADAAIFGEELGV